MILDEQQLRDIVYRLDEQNNKVYTDIEILSSIQTYIHERKGIDVGEIQRPNGSPVTAVLGNVFQIVPDIHLMDIAFNDVLKYYINKFNLKIT